MAIKKQLFAAAVSQRLDPRVVATWNPDLPRTPRVLVPMQVDALVVRQEGGIWADCRMREPDPAAPGAIDAGALLPDPFAELPAPRPRGVHLHWALPDGLTRGVGSAPPDEATDAERARLNGVTFPAIPDRWLVMRIGGASRRAAPAGTVSLSRRAVTGWVIESGGKQPKATPVGEWTEPGPTRPLEEGGDADENRPRQSLTALGLGDPAWAAYYDNVSGRLAFHDDLAGVENGPLAYLVCGWYADPARDVLGDSITSLVAFEQRLAELAWELPPGSYGQARAAYDRVRSAALSGLETREASAMPLVRDALKTDGVARIGAAKALEFEAVAQGALIDREGRPVGGYHRTVDVWWPKYTLLHGSVVGIGWPNDGIPAAPSGLLGGEVGGPPDPGNVKVAIGHGLTDALSALLAANNGTPDEARALEAALLGAGDELDEVDAAARVDVRLHAASFGSLPAGYETETVMQRPPTAPPRSPVVDPKKTDPGVFRNAVPKQPVGGKATGGKGLADVKVAGTMTVEGRANPKVSGVKVAAGARLADLITDLRWRDEVKTNPAAEPAPDPDPDPVPVEVKRALPRYFIPSDPVLLVQGINRSFKHGGDGRFSETGRLPCRVSDMTTRELAPMALRDLPGGGRFKGADVVDRGVANGSVPVECDDLLAELAVLDPGSATFAARSNVRGDTAAATEQVNRAARTFAVEQTVWWATRDPRRDVAPLAARSGLSGYLPCTIAVSPPVRPWVPLHLDWEVEFVPHDTDAWALGEIDFDATPDQVPAADQLPAGITLRGRALLTPGAAQTAASAVRQTLERATRSGGSASLRPGSIERYHSEIARVLLDDISRLRTRAQGDADDDLRSLADALEQMDVLAGALDRFHTRLRGGFVADGEAAPAPGASAPSPFVPLRAGFLRILRLRLVDCFGQILDLAGSANGAAVDMTKVVRSEPMTVSDRPDLLELAPRFTAPTRLLLRFFAADDSVEARGDVSPVCGFLLPDHLDAELQFHAADGNGLGAVRFDRDAGVLWEDAPGRPGAVGASPARAIADTHLAGIAQGLLDWGLADTTSNDPARETALSALLRLIDTSLWTVDPFGHTGDEHLSLLVGHPVAVLRARLTLEVDDPILTDDLAAHLVPVRLGALAQWQDGLLAYYVDDDYRRLHIADPAAAGFARPLGPGQGFLQAATRTSNYYTQFASDIGVDATEGATPVSHDFVDTSGVIMLRPGQTVMLTLLVEPHSAVHVTSGITPRKAIGTRREWVAPGLANIAPTFRFGPVLVDPKRIRMPVASEIRGTWSWCHRVTATTWQEDEVVNATGDAQLPRDPVEGQEGWLKLTPEPPARGDGA